MIMVPPSWVPITYRHWLVWVCVQIERRLPSPAALLPLKQTALSLSPTCSSDQSRGPNARCPSFFCLIQSLPKDKTKQQSQGGKTNQLSVFIHSLSAAQSCMLGRHNLTEPLIGCHLLGAKTLNNGSCPGHFLPFSPSVMPKASHGVYFLNPPDARQPAAPLRPQLPAAFCTSRTLNAFSTAEG